MNADGTKVVIGSYNANYTEVYEYIGNNWILYGNKIDIGEVGFGFAVSMNDAGDIIAVSSLFGLDSPNNGKVGMFQYNDGTWDQIGALLVGNNEWD